jgi:AcrR family transcriptional regulator
MSALLRRPRVDRERLEAALVDEVVEKGFSSASVDGVCARAGADLVAFESVFNDLEDAFYQVCKRFVAEFTQRLLAAFATETSWRDQIRALAYAMFNYVDEDRRRGYFLFVESLAAGERTHLLREEGVDLMIELIDRGRGELADPDSLTPATAQAIAGSIFQEIRRAVQRDDQRAEDLLPQLMYNVVAPYVGAGAAAEELSIPPPAAHDPGGGWDH